MGQRYDIGLQAGKKVAEAVDAFIAKQHKSDKPGENFDPEKRKVLKDGSTVYKWHMKWNLFLYKDEKAFIAVLEQFDDDELDKLEIPDEEIDDYAYKLIAVGDEGGQDEYSNEAGYDLFDGLYNGCGVNYPDGWEDAPAMDVETRDMVIIELARLYDDLLESNAISAPEDDANKYYSIIREIADSFIFDGNGPIIPALQEYAKPIFVEKFGAAA